MWNKLSPETLFGGVCGLVALVAVIAEVILNDATPGVIAGGVKDFAGTMVAVAVLIVAVRSLLPRKAPTGFAETLDAELQRWVEQSVPLIHRAVDCPDKIRFYLITDLEKIFTVNEDELKEIAEKGSRKSGSFCGRFVELPLGIPGQFTFYLNKATFSDRITIQKDRSPEAILEFLAAKVSENINKNFADFCKADSGKESVTVRLNRPPSTPEDAKRIVEVIEHVLTLYTIAT